MLGLGKLFFIRSGIFYMIEYIIARICTVVIQDNINIKSLRAHVPVPDVIQKTNRKVTA